MSWEYDWGQKLICITSAFKSQQKNLFFVFVFVLILHYPLLQTWFLCISNASYLGPTLKIKRAMRLFQFW